MNYTLWNLNIYTKSKKLQDDNQKNNSLNKVITPYTDRQTRVCTFHIPCSASQSDFKEIKYHVWRRPLVDTQMYSNNQDSNTHYPKQEQKCLNAFALIQFPCLICLYSQTDKWQHYLSKIVFGHPQRYTTVVKTTTKNIQRIFRTTYSSNRPIPN
jgi:hypothetical protein